MVQSRYTPWERGPVPSSTAGSSSMDALAMIFGAENTPTVAAAAASARTPAQEAGIPAPHRTRSSRSRSPQPPRAVTPCARTRRLLQVLAPPARVRVRVRAQVQVQAQTWRCAMGVATRSRTTMIAARPRPTLAAASATRRASRSSRSSMPSGRRFHCCAGAPCYLRRTHRDLLVSYQDRPRVDTWGGA